MTAVPATEKECALAVAEVSDFRPRVLVSFSSGDSTRPDARLVTVGTAYRRSPPGIICCQRVREQNVSNRDQPRRGRQGDGRLLGGGKVSYRRSPQVQRLRHRWRASRATATYPESMDEGSVGSAVTVWQRSSFCAYNACIEVASLGDSVALRDSKNVDQPALTLPDEEWISFLDGVLADSRR